MKNLRPISSLSLLFAVALGLQPGTGSAEDTVVLFNGKDLKGWVGNATLWRVDKGEIVGTVKDRLAQNEWLVHELPIGDFRLTVDVKLTTKDNNSGIQFRSRPRKDDKGRAVVDGYQADIGGKEGEYWGKLYEEHGRQWLWEKSCASRVQPGAWNTYEILAIGSKIQTAINGGLCVDLDDADGAREGIVALQLHSGGPMEVRFRKLKVKVDPSEKRLTTVGEHAKKATAEKGLTPQQAVAAMKVPEGFKVSLIAAEPDVRQPVAVTWDHRGRLWVAEAFSYPKRRAEPDAKDRILIFEDADADGTYETRKVFADKLNLVSGLEVGFGGVWVGAAPNLLFIPDADGDDKPDSEPRVLLDGWDDKDSHETLNSFIWGPDGWLYGNHGVFNKSKVGKPGTPDAARIELSSGVWRYHPTRHQFEVYAYGGSNQWGLDFDDDGQAFMTTCRSRNGGGPVTHLIQGGYYWRQAGSHEWPHVYDPIMASAMHDHGAGGAGEIGSDDKYGGHSHVGSMIYLGDQWPERYRNTLFTHNLHGGRINHELNERLGSGYVTKHASEDFLFVNDSWFVGVDLLYGPDGSMFMIDWYDRQHCHHSDVEAWDRSNGRIYRVDYGDPKRVKVDLAKLTDRELVELQLHKNDWYVRMSRRLLQERVASRGRIDADARRALTKLIGHQDTRRQLRAIWATHSIGGLGEQVGAQLLAAKDERVRGWAVRLLNDHRDASPRTRATMTKMAQRETSPFVRVHLASAAQRIPVDARWGMVEALAAHGDDAKDRNLPQMVWFATEALVAKDVKRALRIAETSQLPGVARSIYRRAALEPQGLELVVAQLGRATDDARRTLALEGISKALEGRRGLTRPRAWDSASALLTGSPDVKIRRAAEKLAAQFGDARVFPELRRRLADVSLSREERLHAFETLALGNDIESVALFQRLLDDPSFRTRSLRVLARFEDDGTAPAILSRYAKLRLTEKQEAVNTLSVRPASALALLKAVEGGVVPVKDVLSFNARQMAKFDDREIGERLEKIWGKSRRQSQEKRGDIARLRTVVNNADAPSNNKEGHAVFQRVCAPCHKLFGEGAEIGPDLTESNRKDMDYLLENVVDPSALIGKDFQLTTVETRDGQQVAGMIQSETKDTLKLRTLAEEVVLSRKDIAKVSTSDVSMMPDGLLESLSEQEVRSLLRYVAYGSEVPGP